MRRAALRSWRRGLPRGPARRSSGGAVVACCEGLLSQKAELLESIARQGPEKYAEPCPRQGASIGQHMRHSLQHMQALLGRGAAAEASPVEYDARQRGSAIERDVHAALRATRELRRSLGGVGDLDRRVRVTFMLSGDDDSAETFESNLGRELFFVAHHAVHHNATMAAIAAEIGVRVPAGFGRAPSTRRHDRLTS